jgi:hypothetical protein
MTANPFGVSYFKNDKEMDGSHTLNANGELLFQYRIVVHSGATCEANIAGRYQDFINGPTVEIQ